MGERARRHTVPGYVATITALAVAAGLLAIIDVARMPLPQWWRPLLVVIAVMAGELARVSVRFRSHRLQLAWGEGALIVGLVLLPPSWLVVCTPVGITAVYLRRLPAIKAVFNVASLTLGTTLGVIAYQTIRPAAISGLALTVNGPGLLALAIAALVYTATSAFATSVVIALSGGGRFTEVLRSSSQLIIVTTVGNIGVAFIVLAIAHTSYPLAVALPILVYAVHTAYHHRLAALTERSAWQRLDAATHALLPAAGASAVLATASTGAADLFSADAVDVELNPGQAGAGGALSRHHGSSEHTATEVMVPLGSDGEDGKALGQLRIRFRGRVTLQAREEAMLSTYAASVSAAVQTAQLLAASREEARRRADEATHDALTGLFNRAGLFDRGAAALAEVSRTEGIVALLLIDLDRFKEINDSLGHPVGDRLLCHVGAQLQGIARRGDAVARLGGDEFALLLTDQAFAAAQTVAKLVGDVLTHPVDLDGVPVSADASVGIAATDGGDSAVDMAELLRRADIAMYRAKRAGTGTATYGDDPDDTDTGRPALIAELRTALTTGALHCHYQPQLDLRTGRPAGVEALARWQHPRRGLLAAGDFITAVESDGAIRDLTLHVLDSALAQARRWPDQLGIAVNLSARNLLDPSLPAAVGALLHQHGVAAGQLTLEITETAVLRRLEVVETVLRGLRKLGVALSLDDFGTGFSSLAALSRLDVQEVKVDQSFVQQMLTSPADAAIVRSTIDLAHSLSLRVVAEGVETADQQRALTRLGCDVAQGHYVARPQPIEVALATVRELAFTARRASMAPVVPLARRTARPS